MTSVFEVAVSLGVMMAILAGGYISVVYFSAVYWIDNETKRKNKEDGDV